MRTRISYLAFKKSLSRFPVFSVADVQKAFPDMHKRRLHEWVEKGFLTRVSKGYYIFSEIQIDETFLYRIANYIYDPSYISLLTALSYYGLIPEFVAEVMSVSTKKTTTLKSLRGVFTYASVKYPLMFGYNIVLDKSQTFVFKMAQPEKAVLDFLYLNPGVDSEAAFAELRINIEEFTKKVDIECLNQYLTLFKNKALTKRVYKFMEYIKNA